MRVMMAVVVLVLLSGPALAAQKTFTLFLDAARVEEELATTSGVVEISLPPGIQANSLRVKPAAGCDIVRVDVNPAQSGRPTREEGRLTEQRERLTARLKALDTREEIFTAAAKSQSGKAPRKTKANPEPLENIRRGTDFALSQLEEVYRLRRRTEKELQEVEARLATLAKERNLGASQARVRLRKKVGKVKVSYVLTDLGWKPCYDFRLAGDGHVSVTQRALLPPLEKGAALQVVAATLAASAGGEVRPLTGTDRAAVAEYRFPVEREEAAAAPQPSLLFTFRNKGADALPAGEASCFRRGEYLGALAFAGALPGEAREVACGR